jgi:hypothetical protein
MLQTPREVASRFDRALASAGIAEHIRPHYRRWLRFYLDFCEKYQWDPKSAAAVKPFCDKLESKGQEDWKRHQASAATRSTRTRCCAQPSLRRRHAMARIVLHRRSHPRFRLRPRQLLVSNASMIRSWRLMLRRQFGGRQRPSTSRRARLRRPFSHRRRISRLERVLHVRSPARLRTGSRRW